jgi:NAD(P)-dependent dehydrogenase (short-subunit alcohol dehydrogenase family)
MVYAGMRNPERGGAELRGIAEQENLPIRLVTMDVDQDDSVKQAVAQAMEEAGHIDALVNNAGIGTSGPVEETSMEQFRGVMETNFFGALRCIKAVVPSMRERRSGTIVNVTSVAGRLAIAPQAPYCSSKWALEGLSEAMGQEVKAFGIRVAIVEPGVIATPIFGKQPDWSAESPYPQGRRIEALFAASLQNPVSPYVVGEKIREIIESGTDKLRHPVGPDAAPFLAWRASMTDEQWLAWGAQTDEEWMASIKQSFGLDVKL